ncbi:hypothetical protein GJ744_003031 [Endocarpon pusillum]|uniref:Uncharacterized protein n=1 Tax=Endocarpon pusillum TaxID=364733 RepID=A0A8H7E2B0_9EURO|nr:hypothetical protein GJ744_003031 [Endocarpon pusillum]
MVDQKHRYGSSLRKYHEYWKSQPTPQNFFYWLDHGDGKEVELPECDRVRLEKEQVRYLSREERFNYLVMVDEQGLLRWAKNGEKVWTEGTLYKDSMKGIVPINDQGPTFHYNVHSEGRGSGSTSDSDEEDQPDRDDADKRYLNEDYHNAKGVAKLSKVGPAVAFNHLIRGRTKQGHKWIFVADTSFRLYVGIKQSGAFQHSSFLHGARISAAGLIKIKDGQLRNLAPLSGHYRPSAANFRSFIHNLQDEGTDMSRVSISKSFAVLIGTQIYTRTKRKMKDIETSLKHQKDNLEKVRERYEHEKGKSQSGETEREYLEEHGLDKERLQRQKKDKNLESKIVTKLGVRHKNNNSQKLEGGSPETRLDSVICRRVLVITN